MRGILRQIRVGDECVGWKGRKGCGGRKDLVLLGVEYKPFKDSASGWHAVWLVLGKREDTAPVRWIFKGVSLHYSESLLVLGVSFTLSHRTCKFSQGSCVVDALLVKQSFRRFELYRVL